MAYPGEIKHTSCPLCGEKVKLTCGRDFMFYGTCPSCKKAILEYGGKPWQLRRSEAADSVK